MKFCKGCQEDHAVSEFGPYKNSKDGLAYECRAHLAAVQREKRLKDPERFRAAGLRYRQKNRQALRVRQKAWAAQHPEYNKAYGREWRLLNQEKHRESARRWQAEHPEHVRARITLWRKANPEKDSEYSNRRRALKSNAQILPITAADIRLRFSMFPGCWMCGGPKESVDHVKPLSRGGPHILANLRPACCSCNARKNDTWPFPVAKRAAA